MRWHIKIYREPSDLYGELELNRRYSEEFGPHGLHRLSGKELVNKDRAERMESLRNHPRYYNSAAAQRLLYGESLVDIVDATQRARNPWMYGRKRKDYNMGVDGLTVLVKEARALRVSPALSPRRPTALAAYSAMLGAGAYEAVKYLSSHEMIPQQLSDDASWLGAAALVVAGMGYVFSRIRRNRNIKEMPEKARTIDSFFYPFDGVPSDALDTAPVYVPVQDSDLHDLRDASGDGNIRELELKPNQL